jgi:diguanylate cyclase
MEAEEKRWRQIEKILRLMINRLCAAGMGVNETLDTELAVIAAANRRQAEVEELENLVNSLTTAVTAVDLVAPVLPRGGGDGRWDATCAAAALLLDRLALSDSDVEPKAGTLRLELTKARSDAELATVLEQTADIVRFRGESAEAERQEAAAVLANVNLRLAELSRYFSASVDLSRTGQDDSAQFDARMVRQMSELSLESSKATNLAALQALVTAGLESVQQSVQEFRAAEQRRTAEQIAQAEQMGRRVAELEAETRLLNASLAAERNRARIDPLTGINNRKAFDERIEQEIARRASTLGPVTLLVWDVDDFKAINDTFGHRAGDRVLQTVARCLAQGIRSTDFAARIGGEEFAMIMVGLSLEASQTIADELRETVQMLRLHFRGTPVKVTLSCGMALLQDHDTPGRAFERADAALYKAKNAGKNRCIAAGSAAAGAPAAPPSD